MAVTRQGADASGSLYAAAFASSYCHAPAGLTTPSPSTSLGRRRAVPASRVAARSAPSMILQR
jgi:hypothetical protein